VPLATLQYLGVIMFDAKIQQQLTEHFRHITTPVVLSLNLDLSKKSAELKVLADQLAQLPAPISVELIDDVSQKRPSMAVHQVGELPAIRFSGVPSGHEFSSLILAILQVGGHPPSIKNEVLKRVQALVFDTAVHFTSYISLSCQTCPGVVQALNTLAVLVPNVSHEMVDGSVFQEEVENLEIMAVPSVYRDGVLFSQGAINLESILNKLDTGHGQQRAAALSVLDPFDVIVVGGGPAGASAAIYAARKGFKTAVVAQRFGGQVMDTLSIENFISVTSTEGPKLVANLEQHVLDYDVDIINAKVEDMTAAQQSVSGYVQLALDNGAILKAQSVIVATGARWRELNVPGEAQYRNRGVAYCPHCDGPLFKGKEVAVVGGGNSGIEAAIDLAGITKKVTVLEFADKLLADQVLQDKANSMGNIEIVLNAQTTEVIGDGSKVTEISYTSRLDQSAKHVAVDGIFVQIGLVPNSDFAKETLALTPGGEIIADQSGQTSVPGIFAAGDVTTSPYKQIIIAMGSGATAALGAFDYIIRNPKVKAKAA